MTASFAVPVLTPFTVMTFTSVPTTFTTLEFELVQDTTAVAYTGEGVPVTVVVPPFASLMLYLSTLSPLGETLTVPYAPE